MNGRVCAALTLLALLVVFTIAVVDGTFTNNQAGKELCKQAKDVDHSAVDENGYLTTKHDVASSDPDGPTFKVTFKLDCSGLSTTHKIKVCILKCDDNPKMIKECAANDAARGSEAAKANDAAKGKGPTIVKEITAYEKLELYTMFVNRRPAFTLLPNSVPYYFICKDFNAPGITNSKGL